MPRRPLIACLSLLVVLASAAVAVWVAAPSLLQPRVEDALTRAAGRPVTVGGIRLALDNGLEILLSRLAVANVPGGSRPELLTVQSITLKVDLSALLHGALRIPVVHVGQPDLLLEVDASGRGNWDLPREPAVAVTEAAPASKATSPSASIQLGEVTIEHGRVAFRDGRDTRVYKGEFDGRVEASADPAPFSATFRADLGEMVIEGKLDRTAPLQRSSLSLTGHVLLPERIDIVGRADPGQAGVAVSATANGLGADVTASGVLDPATRRLVGPVVVEAKLAEASTMAARLGIPALMAPATFHAAVRQEGKAVTLRELRLAALPGDIAGELDIITLSSPPALRGSLTSRRLDLAKLMSPSAAHPVAATPSVSSPNPPATPTPVASPSADQPFRLLDHANADLRLAVAELHDPRVTVRDLSGHLVIQDGKLILDPFAGTGPGGRFTLAVRADGRAAPPTLAVVLHAPGLALQPFVTLLGLTGGVTGTAAIDADLRAVGATRPEWLRSLAGRASVTMRDGDIDLGALRELLAAARLPIDPRGQAHLRCLVLRAGIDKGVANVSPLVIDATTLLIQGSGTVDLVQQTLALRLRPLLRTGPGIVVPMAVTGPWAQPKIDVDRGDLSGVLKGLTGQLGDPCRDAGVLSDAPPPATKPLKPADLLRSLLR